MTGMNDGDDPKKGGKGIEDIFSGLKHIFGGEDKPPLRRRPVRLPSRMRSRVAYPPIAPLPHSVVKAGFTII